MFRLMKVNARCPQITTVTPAAIAVLGYSIAYDLRRRMMNIANFSAMFRTRLSWAMTLSLAALGAYLLWTHTGHVVFALPYLLLLACPLLHMFGHRHGHRHNSETQQ